MLRIIPIILVAACTLLLAADACAVGSPPDAPVKGRMAAPSGDADAAGTLPGRPCYEDEPCWQWATMGNLKRGIVSMHGTPRIVNVCEYQSIMRDHTRRERRIMGHGMAKGDGFALRHGCAFLNRVLDNLLSMDRRSAIDAALEA